MLATGSGSCPPASDGADSPCWWRLVFVVLVRHSHVVESSQVHDDVGVHLGDLHCGGAASATSVAAAAASAGGGRRPLGDLAVGPVRPPGVPWAALHPDVVELAVLLDHLDAHVADVVDDHPDGAAQVLGPLEPRDSCRGEGGTGSQGPPLPVASF